MHMWACGRFMHVSVCLTYTPAIMYICENTYHTYIRLYMYTYCLHINTQTYIPCTCLCAYTHKLSKRGLSPTHIHAIHTQAAYNNPRTLQRQTQTKTQNIHQDARADTCAREVRTTHGTAAVAKAQRLCLLFNK
jgi:hypothetical protein